MTNSTNQRTIDNMHRLLSDTAQVTKLSITQIMEPVLFIENPKTVGNNGGTAYDIDLRKIRTKQNDILKRVGCAQQYSFSVDNSVSPVDPMPGIVGRDRNRRGKERWYQ